MSVRRLLTSMVHWGRDHSARGSALARARASTSPGAPVTHTLAAAPGGLPAGPHDVITRSARRLLPGARLRRRLFWRYTLVRTA